MLQVQAKEEEEEVKIGGSRGSWRSASVFVKVQDHINNIGFQNMA